jgi:hypothetical protein
MLWALLSSTASLYLEKLIKALVIGDDLGFKNSAGELLRVNNTKQKNILKNGNTTFG